MRTKQATQQRQREETTLWELVGLQPSPEEEWSRLRAFLMLSNEDLNAMAETVEPLFRHGPDLVVRTYDYLLNFHETAVILGWTHGADEAHLSERRRFFTIWLARTLGLDFSDDLARYLFRAGKYHAGHGPRRIKVPDRFVTGSISLVHNAFAEYLAQDIPQAAVVPKALAAWNKYLSMHLHLMLMGASIARELDEGDFTIPVHLYGRLRDVIGVHEVNIALAGGARVEHALQKFFNYFPQARPEVFELSWQSSEQLDDTGTPWLTVQPAYRIRPMWSVRLNGRDLLYAGGLDVPLTPGDEISMFPPGR